MLDYFYFCFKSTPNHMRTRLLSRMVEYEATHGITQQYKDYLSIIKDQGNTSYCWAYSLTSAIEMKHALNTGNRLMLDPYTIINRTTDWWKKNDKRNDYKQCHEFEVNGYIPICAVDYMYRSGQKMFQRDGNKSNLIINNYGDNEIKTLADLYSVLDKHSLLYTGIYADERISQPLIYYYDESQNFTNHQVVLTSVGKIDGLPGIYAEILNSYGYNSSYDGLIYVKIADNETSELHNNLGIFDEVIWIDVWEVNDEQIYFILFIAFASLFAVVTVFMIVACILSCMSNSKEKKEITYDDDTVENIITQPLNQDQVVQRAEREVIAL